MENHKWSKRLKNLKKDQLMLKMNKRKRKNISIAKTFPDKYAINHINNGKSCGLDEILA